MLDRDISIHLELKTAFPILLLSPKFTGKVIGYLGNARLSFIYHLIRHWICQQYCWFCSYFCIYRFHCLKLTNIQRSKSNSKVTSDSRVHHYWNESNKQQSMTYITSDPPLMAKNVTWRTHIFRVQRIRISSKAASSPGKAKEKSLSSKRCGTTFCPFNRRLSPISPKMAFTTNPGKGKIVGREMVLPIA